MASTAHDSFKVILLRATHQKRNLVFQKSVGNQRWELIITASASAAAQNIQNDPSEKRYLIFSPVRASVYVSSDGITILFEASPRNSRALVTHETSSVEAALEVKFAARPRTG